MNAIKEIEEEYYRQSGPSRTNSPTRIGFSPYCGAVAISILHPIPRIGLTAMIKLRSKFAIMIFLGYYKRRC